MQIILLFAFALNAAAPGRSTETPPAYVQECQRLFHGVRRFFLLLCHYLADEWFSPAWLRAKSCIASCVFEKLAWFDERRQYSCYDDTN